MLNIDGDQISIGIDLDQGGRLTSLQWRDMQFAVPFNGDVLRWGWYAMVPWAGPIKNGLIKDSKNITHQLPTTFRPPHAIHGLGFFLSWEDLGNGKQLLEFPAPYNGASVTQHFEILGDALRWSLEYEANGCDLPFSLGFQPWIARDIGKGNSAELVFKANKMMVRDQNFALTGDYLPQPPEPWNDTFVEVIGTPEIIWPGTARLTIESDAPYWTVDTEYEDGICVEPHTTPLPGLAGDNYIEALFTFTDC
jgi:aldose 1-epimerase